MPRRRFQRGCLIKRGKNPVWVGIFREDRLQTDGTIKRIQRKVVLGPCNKYLSALRMLHFSLTWMPSTLPLHQPRK